MANDINSNPIVLDTWGSDITIKSKGDPLCIKKIRLLSAADGDIFCFERQDGTQIFNMVQTGAGDVVEVDFGVSGQLFTDGVQVDVSDCTGLGASDIVWIYLK